MELILGTLKEFGLWAAILAVFFAYWLFILGGLHEKGNTAGRDRWLMTLREGDWASRYQRRVIGGLTWIDKRLTPEAFVENAKIHPASLRAAFSFNLLNITLVLALLYPVFSLLTHWAITGADGAIAGLVVIPAEPRGWVRLAVIGGLAGSIACSIASAKALDQNRIGFAVSGLVVGLLLAVASAFAFAFAGAFVGVFVGVFTVAGLFLPGWIGRRTGLPALALFIYFALMLAVIAIAVSLSPTIAITPSGEDPRGLILFLGILPLLNGLADFLSTGATRWLIRKTGANPLAWLGDIVIALLILTALTFTFIALVTFVTPQDGIPLIDLAALFEDLRTRPEAYWWLSFMLFSTLLPTAIHLIVALSSLMTITPKSWRLYIADEIEAGGKGDWVRGRHGKILLALLNAFAMWWPTCVVVYGGLWIWTGDNGLRDLLIWLAEWWARWLGVYSYPMVAL